MIFEWYVYLLYLFFSLGARPKFSKRNSMDSVELWKYSSDKVKLFSQISVKESIRKRSTPKIVINPSLTICSLLQNGENQDLESIPRRSKSQLSQPGKRKGYPDSQSSDERPWLDSPVDTDDITVQVPPPVPVSVFIFTVFFSLFSSRASCCVLMWCQV